MQMLSIWNSPTICLFKLKALMIQTHKLEITQSMIIGSHFVENIVGKGENAGYQHFSFSHNVFKSPFPLECFNPLPHNAAF